MPVLIRESQTSERPDVLEVTYKTNGGILTEDGEALAKRNDRIIKQRMRQIAAEMREAGLLKSKGKPGVLRLWWEVGRRLGFLSEIDVGDERDRIWLWRALYDHAGSLNPTRSGRLPVRVRHSPRNSYFRYMAMLGQLEWSVAQAIGDWSSWVELCDSRCFNDGRLVTWFVNRTRSPNSPLKRLERARNHRNLFRKLAKAIRHRFHMSDMSVFDENELYAELDALAASVLGGESVESRG